MTSSERIRIAQELHDGIAQDLVALSYSLDLLLAEANTPPATRIELRNIIFSLTSMIKKVRTEIFELRSNSAATLDESLRALIAELGSSIKLNLVLEECNFSELVQIEIHAISRELLRNSIKHSGASVIELRIEKSENGSTYSYTDNGKGIDPISSMGLGIRGIAERCALIESELIMNSDKRGTTYTISIPT